MSGISFNTSTYAEVTWDHFDALARCDATGFPVLHKDLRKHMVWAGNELIWNGFLVHKDFNYEPNPFTNIPPVYGDPEPVLNARSFSYPWAW